MSTFSDLDALNEEEWDKVGNGGRGKVELKLTITSCLVLGRQLQGKSASVSQSTADLQCESRWWCILVDLVDRRHRSAWKRDGLLCLQSRG